MSSAVEDERHVVSSSSGATIVGCRSTPARVVGQ
jgi:hypothetical protein